MLNNIISRFAAAASVIVLMASCEKAPSVITEDSPEFSGKMTVLYEGEPFDQNGIKVLVELNADKTILEVPVTEEADGIWSFYGDGITPWAMGGPYDGYRVDELRGTVSDSTLEFSLDFYNTKKKQAYPTSYSGDR